MISLLRGKVDNVVDNVVTVDVAGVGYEVWCTRACLAELSQGAEFSVVVYTDVKQDGIRLYGFNDQLEKQVFLLLIRVKGVGAKSASEILSRVEKRQLLRAIGAGDLGKLQGIRGIGKKTAERLVVELKDKVAEFILERESIQRSIEKTVVGPFEEAAEALQALGFSRKDAERAVKEVELRVVGAPLNSGEIVKEALRFV